MNEPWRVIVAGSRGVTDFRVVHTAILSARVRWAVHWPITVVSGGARGVDQLGERWARETGSQCIRYPADWDKHGRAAGMIRNEEMAKNAEALIAVWDGKSRGTANMILQAHRHKLLVYVEMVP